MTKKAKSSTERSQKSAEKRKELGIEELRLRVAKGEKAWLLELMAWTEDTEQGSVMAGCLRYVHSLGKEGAKEALRSRHEIVISENVAREFHNQSMKEVMKDPGDEIINPKDSEIKA